MAAARVFIGVGSNIAPEANIPLALERLAKSLSLRAVSTFYRTAPVGPAGQPPFVNGVVEALSELPPRKLKFHVLRPIEASLGRRRSGADKYAPRTIDLDLLLYGDAVLSQRGLTLPDPDIRERPFLAAGLLELEPGLVLPDGTPLRPAPGAAMEPLADFSRLLKERWTTRESKTR